MDKKTGVKSSPKENELKRLQFLIKYKFIMDRRVIPLRVKGETKSVNAFVFLWKRLGGNLGSSILILFFFCQCYWKAGGDNWKSLT